VTVSARPSSVRTPKPGPFSISLFQFLDELAAHNASEWFFANQERYWRQVRDPALAFITTAGPVLQRLSPRIVADPRPIGGSLFRIYRDLRYSRDKTPYKTNVSMRFPVRGAKSQTVEPGYYLHLATGGSFLAAGVWNPDADCLAKIRRAIVTRADEWGRARKGGLDEGDGLLARSPRGFDPDHRFAGDLRRRDFVTTTRMTDAQVTDVAFMRTFGHECRRRAPLVRFLVTALGGKW
jgi:uncharacterized protein (TIGR02453 family)